MCDFTIASHVLIAPPGHHWAQLELLTLWHGPRSPHHTSKTMTAGLSLLNMPTVFVTLHSKGFRHRAFACAFCLSVKVTATVKPGDAAWD